MGHSVEFKIIFSNIWNDFSDSLLLHEGYDGPLLQATRGEEHGRILGFHGRSTSGWIVLGILVQQRE